MTSLRPPVFISPWSHVTVADVGSSCLLHCASLDSQSDRDKIFMAPKRKVKINFIGKMMLSTRSYTFEGQEFGFHLS